MKKDDFYYLNKYKQNRIKASGSIAGITLGVILVFFLIGYSIDKVFNTKPYGLIVFLVVSFPVVQIILYRTLKRIFKNE